MDDEDLNHDSEDCLSSDNSIPIMKHLKSKKRSLVERELETNLTAHVTSPISNGDTNSHNTSRYGRARKLKTDADFCGADKIKNFKCFKTDKSPLKSPGTSIKMFASNSPLKIDANTNIVLPIESQIECRYNENISLSLLNSDSEKTTSPSKKPRVYVRKDIQCKDKEETATLIKNMFSPTKTPSKTNNLSLALDRSTEKYDLPASVSTNCYLDNNNVVKALNFDNDLQNDGCTRHTNKMSQQEISKLEASCAYDVGDLAWARIGSYPFWPCIITRDPYSDIYVKKKSSGRLERNFVHVTFFGDNGRRGWVSENMLRKYLGHLEFEMTREKFTLEEKKKDPKLYAAFFVSEKKQQKWNVSVEEAECFLREDKVKRLDLLYDMLIKIKGPKTTPKRNKSIKMRKDSDVSLSESLLDTLFSEEDTKTDDIDRNKSRKKSLDVSEVVTACLDNMAAKTGITKIKKQSHMDRWLQKAKSKTPEKTSDCKIKIKKDGQKKSTKSKSQSNLIQTSLHLNKNFPVFNLNKSIDGNISYNKINEHSQNGLLWFQNHISKEFSGEGQRIETTYNSISNNNEKVLEDDAKSEKQSTLCTEELKNGPHSLKTLNNGEIFNFMNGSKSPVYSSEDSLEKNNFEDTSIKKAVQKNENINEDSINKICRSNGNDEANGRKDLQIVSVFSIAEECSDISVKKNTNTNELFIVENVSKNQFMENDYIVNNIPQKDTNNENILQNKIQSSQLKLLNKNEEHTTKQTNGISSLDKSKVVDDLKHVKTPHLECNSLPTANGLSTNSEQKLPTINKTDNIILETPVKTQKKSLNLRKKLDESVTENIKLDSIEKCNKNLNYVLRNEKIFVQNTIISENLVVNGNTVHPPENSPKRKKLIGVANDAQASTSTEISLNCAEGNTVGNVDLLEKCDSTKDETKPVNGCIKNLEESQNSIKRKSILDETEIDSEDEIPISKRVLRIRHNTENVSKSISSIETNVTDNYDKFNRSYDDPEFLKYMKDSQDPLMEENPHLTHNEIVAYLYRTWIFDQDQKSESTKNDSVPHVDLVKGLSEDYIQIQPKKQKKRVKMDREPQFRNEGVVREKVERETRKKIVKPFYNEAEDTDTDSEYLEFKDSVPNSGQITSNNDDRELVMEHSEHEVVDEVEYYFEQLTQYKPNLFKGLIRERVCDVCEKPGNLSKCKGPCGGFYHGDCAKKEIEQEERHALHRGRKKKKTRGRKSKADNNNDSKFNGTDSESQEDKSQDNISFDDSDKLEFTCRIEINESDFDAKAALQLKEMMKEYQDDSEDYSNDEWDFEDIVAGKCKIVDVKVRKRTDETADSNHYSDFKCNMCLKYDTPPCFVCKSILSPKGNTEFRQRCNVTHCQKYYHTECLEHWPQAHFSAGEPSKNNKKISEHYETLTCPRHVCHTCVSDDPRGCKTRFSGDKLAKCVRCPAVYHSLTRCLPAGSLVLNASNIICTRHREGFGKVPSHVNTSWCFLCAQGGSLICCEYCPTSFHPECLKFKPPEGGYMCEDCETGRLPLHGEMVWAKLGHFRWWPGIILHPSEVPKKIMLKKHCTPGEFVVRFFGQYDHYWMNRGRVFRFQEGDSGRISSQKSKIDDDFMLAVEHAKRASEILKDVQPNEEEEMEIQASVLPPYYVKLKVNKPIGGAVRCKVDMSEANSMTQCECDPNDYEPCGPESQCLNRMLLTECGPSCRAGDRCCNRNFEKRIYPKMIPYRTPQRGWGLKTLQDIKKGQFVIEYVGELIDEEEFRRRMRRKHEIRDENFYFLTLDKDRMIDAGPKGNLARFMNHCCEPNCETQKWTVLGDVRVGLFALHDIKANTEVTFNYNLECAGIEKKQCMCGAARCSGYIGAKPKQDDSQSKKKTVTKRVYRKRKIESPSLSKPAKTKLKSKPKPRELTEIEKDLLIIQSATNGVPSDSESNDRLKTEKESTPKDKKNQRALKRKRVSFSTEEVIIYDGVAKPTNMKRLKLVEEPLDNTPITI